MGPAFPVHEAAVRAEGIVRVVGTPGRTPAGLSGHPQRHACCCLAAALVCMCPPWPSHAPLSLPLLPDHGAATEAGGPAEAGDRPGG